MLRIFCNHCRKCSPAHFWVNIKACPLCRSPQ